MMKTAEPQESITFIASIIRPEKAWLRHRKKVPRIPACSELIQRFICIQKAGRKVIERSLSRNRKTGETRRTVIIPWRYLGRFIQLQIRGVGKMKTNFGDTTLRPRCIKTSSRSDA